MPSIEIIKRCSPADIALLEKCKEFDNIECHCRGRRGGCNAVCMACTTRLDDYEFAPTDITVEINAKWGAELLYHLRCLADCDENEDEDS